VKVATGGLSGIALVRPSRLGDEVTRVLRRKILLGELPPGRTTQEELANLLAVSVTPVREALLRLETEGFIERSPNKSVTVTAITAKDLADIYELHAQISGMITRHACENVAPELLEHLRSRLFQESSEQLVAHDRVEILEQISWQFHRDINLAADSPKLLQAMRFSLRYIPYGFYALFDDWPQKSNEDHLRILETLIEGDPDGSQAAAIAHVRGAGQLLVEYFTTVGHWKLSDS